MEDNKDLREEVVTKVTPTDVDTELAGKHGRFASTLTRNNKKIRADRALTIIDAAQMKYKREIEDSMLKIKKIKRIMEAQLDLSPTDANSLKLVDEFDESDFVSRRREGLRSIFQEEVLLKEMIEDYKELFGETIAINY